MPYKLRKAPGKELYWVITIDTGKKHSKLPVPKEKAEAQMRILTLALGEEPVTQADKQLAEQFEERDIDIIKRAVLGVNCRRIDKELVSTMEDKDELVSYLRSRNCPALIRLEAMMEKKFD